MTTRVARAGAALLFVLVVSGCAVRAAGPTVGPRTGETAARELAAFVAFVKAVHPDAYRFTSEDALDALLAREHARLAAVDVPTERDVGLAFERVVASLHDAHMRVALPMYQPGAPPLSLLPLAVEPVGDELFVDASAPPLPHGTTLVAIDGLEAGAILDTLAPLAIYDGENTAARDRVRAREFVRLYALAFGAREIYEVTVRGPDGVVHTHALRGIDRQGVAGLARMRASRAVRPTFVPGDDPYPVLEPIDAETQRLRLPTFGVTDVEGYEARIAAIVDALATTPRLIVDLRGNEGGLRSLGIALLGHLARDPYVQWTCSSVRVRAIPAPYEDVVTAAFGTSLDVLAHYPREVTSGQHVIEGDPLASLLVPRAPHLAPRLVVLVDALTNSAANELALALRTIRPDAIFVGDEIGGECERHVGELPITYTTPTFGVVVLMSLVRVVHVAVPGCARGHGMRPDIEVVYDRAAFIEGRDPYVEAAADAW